MNKSYVNVPIIMQLEVTECGAACLAMILAYYKKWLPLEEVRRDCGVSRNGSNAKNILKAAKGYGLITKAYQLETQELKTFVSFPCIVHWTFNHFVVVCGFKNGSVLINDPARGKIWIKEKEFEEGFTGICLCFTPKENFDKSGKRPSVFEFAKGRLKGSFMAIAFVIATAFIVSIIEITKVSMLKVFVDFILEMREEKYLIPFVAIFCLLSLALILVMAVKEICLLKINAKFASVGSSSFMWKILHLPMEFFSQRSAGDIQMRMRVNGQIVVLLVIVLAPVILDVAVLIFYLAIMLNYSIVLTFIGVLGVFINILIYTYAAELRANTLRVMMRDEAKLAGLTASGIEMIETIKASGSESNFFERWAGYSASANSARMEYLKIDAKVGMLAEFVSAIFEIFILFIGVWFIMKGEFTVGMLLAFTGFLKAFSKPTNRLIGLGEELGEIRCNIERVEDVMNYPEDKIFEISNHLKEDYDKLSGKIEIRDVNFGYSSLEEPLIKNFNLSVMPGQKIAIVGASGSGKSTIAKLIGGLYRQWSGSILFDGKTINEIDRAEFTGSVAVVDQDVILFNDSISNNIKMWDNSIENFEMILAARDAKIHDAIIERDGGYGGIIYENGKNFSGGEKQRLEIARVLAQDPTIIVMDEATSALDSKTEFEVINSIAERGVSCIIIAHRLSTIRYCDEIFVMDKGIIKERGTHQELYDLGGIYTKLIADA